MGNQQPTGLTSAAAAEQLRQYGPNTIVTKRQERPLLAFLRKFNSPLLWIIIAAAVVSAFVGQRTDAVILILMVTLSAALDYFNTARSEKAVKAVLARVITNVTVIRDGQPKDVPLAEVVPNDLVRLTSGDVIPADGHIIEAKDLYINQSALTGESLPVEKQPITGVPSVALEPGRPDVVLMGTSVVTGYATILVAQTGARTTYGHIAAHLADHEAPTDFERGIKSFSLFLMRVTIVMAGLVFVINAAAGHGWLNSFIFALAIAIGLTPELLPVILTVSLSRGASRMAKRQVIVKRLPAIQNFGRMSVLCTDKTGTLTENKISVVKYVNGVGQSDEEVLRQAYFSSFYHSGVSNPLDAAIRDYRPWNHGGVEKIDEIPFDFERRRESIVVSEQGKHLLIAKGSPEELWSVCTQYRFGPEPQPITDAQRQRFQQTYDELSGEGYRVLGVASRPIGGNEFPYEPNDEHDMIFMGFIALLDPPKEGVRETIQEMADLGVGIKILTGDSLRLTEKICRDIGLPVQASMTGDQLTTLADADWPAAVTRTTIFARIDPAQKERIVKELSQAGEVVGYMGDGINDAPALRAADVGVSVNNAVDVAKETADIILLEHSLAVLKDGIREGRKTFINTRKYIMMGLSSNFGNMFSMTVASAFLPFLPMLPTQILLNNFLYDSSQLSLSSDNVDPADLTRQTGWDLKFIRRFMLIFGPVSSVFDILTFWLLLSVFHLKEGGFQAGWFMESLATQVLVIYIIRTRRLPFLQSRPSAFLLINTVVVVALAWLIPFTPLGAIFQLQAVSGQIVLAIGGIVVAYLVLVELTKRWFYRRFGRSTAPAHA